MSTTNAAYNAGKREIISDLNWKSGGSTVRAALIDASYTFSAAHSTLTAGSPSLSTSIADSSHRGDAALVLPAEPTDGKALVSSSTTFTNAAVSGDATKDLLVYFDAGGTDTDSQSIPLVHFGTGSGLPVTPNSGTITVNWDGTNGVFNI